MDLEQYIKDACRTESQIEEVTLDPNLYAGIIQILIAAGNMLDQIKKNVFYQRDMDGGKLIEEFTNIVGSLDQIKESLSLDGSIQASLAIDPRIFHSIVGITTESVELLEALNVEEFDTTNFLEELGDLNWYQAIGIDAVDGNFQRVLETNIEKLRERYKDKFTEEQANERNIDAEREILETVHEEGC